MVGKSFYATLSSCSVFGVNGGASVLVCTRLNVAGEKLLYAVVQVNHCLWQR